MNTKQQWEQNLEGVKEQLVHLKTTQKRTMVNSNGNRAQQKQMRELLHTQVAPSLTLICLHGYYTALIFYIGSCKYICIFFTVHANDETTSVTCFLSLILDALMCFAPLLSHVCSRAIDTRCNPIWSLLTIRAARMLQVLKR